MKRSTTTYVAMDTHKKSISLGAEAKNVTAVWVAANRRRHERHEAVHACAKIDWRRRNEHPSL